MLQNNPEEHFAALQTDCLKTEGEQSSCRHAPADGFGGLETKSLQKKAVEALQHQTHSLDWLLVFRFPGFSSTQLFSPQTALKASGMNRWDATV